MKNIEIDFVVSWVDGNDKDWQNRKLAHTGKSGHSGDDQSMRYREWNTFKYFFRGVEKNAPWVNKIYLVTDNQLPDFLKINHDKLVIVDHKDYIPNEFLPTFNSNVIESNFHRINGLSEHFVYFNDDMFIIDRVLPEDFFENGLPKSAAVLNAISGIGNDSIQSIEVNNMSTLNKYFNKRKTMFESPNKWFNPKYGLKVFKNVILLPWKYHTGFSEEHIANSFLKSTFSKVWNLEKDLLTQTGLRKVRDPRDINQWLFIYWQICENNFYPRKFNFGRNFNIKTREIEGLKDYIINKRGKIVCINDNVEENDFDYVKEETILNLNRIFPTKSSFEK